MNSDFPSSQDMSLAHLRDGMDELLAGMAAVDTLAAAIDTCGDLAEILDVLRQQATSVVELAHLSLHLSCLGEERWEDLLGSPLAEAPGQRLKGAVMTAMQSGTLQVVEEEGFWGVVVPLTVSGRAVATMNFARYHHAYQPYEVRLCSLVGRYLAGAIARVECLAQLDHLERSLHQEQQRFDNLLTSVLPADVAAELKQHGRVKPVFYESAALLLIDFHSNFAKTAAHLSPEELVYELEYCFAYFDKVIEKYNLEKLRSFSDTYVCLGGIPTPNRTHTIDAVLAALEMQIFMYLRKAYKTKNELSYWDVRICINAGPLLAGVIAQGKFAYDVWGEAANAAAHMQVWGVPGRINVSPTALKSLEEFFDFERRTVRAGGAREELYLVQRIKPSLSVDPGGLLPNDDFIKLYLSLQDEGLAVPSFCQWRYS
ncbi:adenylate/guanylate cyclase domain-containing protein [[Phormidium] sp. ETS-05]|uniref:adenylate/guanylate cyclase domain-containing protein n=1 Tax=[Phormidium] sp. ETS-05 TaxID=222819 RepID=UPI0018EF1F2E|nr:adenylate/guanylate cyclase domain-containing protein [[Phormidium] sp. ETS-05]